MIKEAFSKTFSDTQKAGTVFVHDFHPLAQSLAQRHLAPRAPHATEALLWSYVIQLTSALRAIHAAGLACRVLDVTKVLITGRSRIAIGSTAVYDVLQYDETQQTAAVTAHFQQKDLHDLGILVLTLASNSKGGVYVSTTTRRELSSEFTLCVLIGLGTRKLSRRLCTPCLATTQRICSS